MNIYLEELEEFKQWYALLINERDELTQKCEALENIILEMKDMHDKIIENYIEHNKKLKNQVDSTENIMFYFKDSLHAEDCNSIGASFVPRDLLNCSCHMRFVNDYFKSKDTK